MRSSLHVSLLYSIAATTVCGKTVNSLITAAALCLSVSK